MGERLPAHSPCSIRRCAPVPAPPDVPMAPLPLCPCAPLLSVKPLFPSPPPPPPMPRDPDRAVLVRRALQDRLLETLRYLVEEIDLRRVGGLGEAQAAGYVAGRLNRAEQQATVASFRTGAGRSIATGFLLALVASGGVIAALAWQPATAASAFAIVPVAVYLLWSEIEGWGILGQVLARGASQSVIGVRAAVGNISGERLRVVLTAPLDSAPQAPRRSTLMLILLLFLLHAGLILARLAVPLPTLHWLLLLNAAALFGLSAVVLWGASQRGPQPAVHGAGELAVLIATAEELGELQQVELWTVALGAASVGDAGMRHLLDRYPFPAETCFINLHHMTGGQPVFVTREGLLRERRSDRRLLALASEADAADVSINAEPRQLRRRTLATQPLRAGFRTITITSYADAPGLASPHPATLERCVKLIVGMIRKLDEEPRRAHDV